MSNETVLLISAPHDFLSRFEVESIGSGLCEGCRIVVKDVFSEQLGDAEPRKTSRRRAVLAGANNQLCRLVWTGDVSTG